VRTGVTAAVATWLKGVLVAVSCAGTGVAVGEIGVAERLGRSVCVAAGVLVATAGVMVRVGVGGTDVNVAVGGTGVRVVVAVGRGVSVGDDTGA